jgi:hypothetical protein
MSMLSLESVPKVVEHVVQDRIINVCQTFPPKDNNVQSGKICLKPESFSYAAFNAVSLDGKFQVFLGKHQANSRKTVGILGR